MDYVITAGQAGTNPKTNSLMAFGIDDFPCRGESTLDWLEGWLKKSLG